MGHATARMTVTLLAICLAAVTAHAQCKGTDILPRLSKAHPEIMTGVRKAANKIVNTEAILWRVEKQDRAPSHLFGTMHVADKRITSMPAPATDALKSSKLVALEIADMSPMAMLKAAGKSPQLMVYTDGSRLDQRLNEAEFKQVSKLLGKAGMPGQMAAIVRPWLISIMLAVPDCEQQRIAQGREALDLQIGNMARKNKAPVIGLETVESQLKSLASVPEADQLAMLRISLALLEEREDMFETLIQSYLRRDLGIILALSDGIAKIRGLKNSGFASFSRELITKRNHKMFDASLPLVDRGGAFIAVGAAHLIGDTGLVALYRKAGFTVTAVN